MTSYTRNRGYPFPSSDREAGNGGLHSELLARAVAADLDSLDAAWANEAQRATVMVNLAADVTGVYDTGEYPLDLDSTEKITTDPGLTVSSGFDVFRVATGGDGWYHLVATMRTRAEGAITANAQHRVLLWVTEDQAGQPITRDKFWNIAFQVGTTDVYNELEAVYYLGSNSKLWMGVLHYNTASTVRVVAAGTSLAATKIVGVS